MLEGDSWACWGDIRRPSGAPGGAHGGAEPVVTVLQLDLDLVGPSTELSDSDSVTVRDHRVEWTEVL